jgi:hypothetical protein
MSSIGIALGALSVWAVGLGLVGAYWVRKEQRCAKERERLRGQQRFSFVETEFSSPYAEHSVRR